MNVQQIRIKPPTFKVVGQRRRVNEYELRAAMLLVATGELEAFTVIGAQGQRLTTDAQGRFDGDLKDIDVGGELALCLHSVNRGATLGPKSREYVVSLLTRYQQ